VAGTGDTDQREALRKNIENISLPIQGIKREFDRVVGGNSYYVSVGKQLGEICATFDTSLGLIEADVVRAHELSMRAIKQYLALMSEVSAVYRGNLLSGKLPGGAVN
jgi:hypothetical protein